MRISNLKGEKKKKKGKRAKPIYTKKPWQLFVSIALMALFAMLVVFVDNGAELWCHKPGFCCHVVWCQFVSGYLEFGCI